MVRLASELIDENGSITKEVMIEFATMHVIAALQQAYYNAKIVHEKDPQIFGGPFVWVDEDSILSSYDLNCIE